MNSSIPFSWIVQTDCKAVLIEKAFLETDAVKMDFNPGKIFRKTILNFCGKRFANGDLITPDGDNNPIFVVTSEACPYIRSDGSEYKISAELFRFRGSNINSIEKYLKPGTIFVNTTIDMPNPYYKSKYSDLFNRPLARGGADAITGFKDPTKCLKIATDALTYFKLNFPSPKYSELWKHDLNKVGTDALRPSLLIEAGWKLKESKPWNNIPFPKRTFLFDKDNFMCILNLRNEIPFIHIILKDVSKADDYMADCHNFRLCSPCKTMTNFNNIMNNLKPLE